ncbi:MULTISPECIES: hypothetical protein [unclassified Aureimonas]|uniref:hypothetical protein n=1 Tax=unclassified Aureimonas TaxID=2615206 RepID=UPI0006F300D7|nr:MULTISPECIES: hypothetical protein [unclassified Aureimonas]KQT57301.1 hypothetical protein ASG62_08090 [Aureimonas sp. Leaf427]KQT76981.1 hypothetical protein ASG54_11955 [Aureimonas sp. Leaf460]
MYFAVRLPRGVDITDEAYYVTHAVEWIRKGFAGSTNLNIQQLSALPTFPVVRLWMMWNGGLEGIILALRWTYAALAVGTALALYDFTRRIGPRSIAVPAGLLAIAFIPFGLPAPSYNTIAMLGSASALCLLGSALLNASADARLRSALLRLNLSALIWVVVGICYPTLVIAPAMSAGVAFICIPHTRRLIITYMGLIAAWGVVGASVLLLVFGIDHLLSMLAYTSQSAQLGGRFTWKIDFVLERLAAEPLATTAFAAMALIPLGLLRLEAARFVSSLSALFVICFCCIMAAGPVAYIKSHDVIILCFIFSLHCFSGLDARSSAIILVRVIVMSGLVCSMITAYTALYSIYNLAIGGFVSAAIGLASFAGRPVERTTLWRIAPLALCLATVGTLTMFRIYGEATGYLSADAERVESGPFLGLRTSPDLKAYIDTVSDEFAQHVSTNETVTVFGPVAGLYLLTDGIPHGISTWPASRETGPEARAKWTAFLTKEPPDAIAYYADPWTKEPWPAEASPLNNYGEVSRSTIGFRTFVLSRRVNTERKP